MKTLIISTIVVLFAFMTMQAQTVEMEKANITKKFEKGELTQTEYREFANKWNQFINEIEKYPDLQYNKSKQIIEFEFVFEFNLSKEVIYKRVMEWAAINFHTVEAATRYNDFESGKIIFKGNFDVPHIGMYKNFWGNQKETTTETKCYQTYLFTVKDNKLKVNIIDIYYERKFSYYYTSYYYDRTIKIPINYVYPITSHKYEVWKEKIDLLEQTSNQINRLSNNLNLYIIDYSKDYKF